MKAQYLLFLYLLFSGGNISGQFLNGDFELNTGYPQTLGEYTLVQHWNNCASTTATPDYYHINGDNGGDLPNTPAATITPYSGKAIMGLTFYNSQYPDYREYISTKLSKSLTVGDTYLISFQLTNGIIPSSSNAGFAIDKIGLLLSENFVVQTDMEPINMTPQFELDTIFYSRNWNKISFRFVADKAYEFVTFGCFSNDAALSISKEESAAKFAYYFVDDFKIANRSHNATIPIEPVKPMTEDEAQTQSEPNPEQPFYIPNSFTPNDDKENDVFIPVINVDENFVFEIYSRWGQVLFSTTERQVGWDGFYKGKPMPEENYVWTLRYTTNEGESRVAKQFHGQITLLR